MLKPIILSLILALGAFVSPPAMRAVALDSTSSGLSTANASSETISHTVVSVTNGAMLVSVHYGSGNTVSVTGVTYNTVALTAVGNRQENATSHGTNEMWQLTAANGLVTGTHDIVITMSGAVGAGNKIGGCATAWTGVDQTTPIDVSGGTTGGPGTAVSGAVVTVTDGAYVIGGVTGTNDNTSATTSLTEYCDINPASVGPFTYGMYTQKATAGSQTMDATLDAGFRWAISIAAMRPAGAAAPSFIPAIINAPIRGGGFDLILWQLTGLVRP